MQRKMIWLVLALALLLVSGYGLTLAQASSVSATGSDAAPTISENEARDIALAYLREHKADFALSDEDIAGLKVARQYVSSMSGVTHVYFRQSLGGLDVYNAVVNVHILPNGEVLHTGNRAVPYLTSSAKPQTASLTAVEAVTRGADALGLRPTEAFRVVEALAGTAQEGSLNDGGISRSAIPVKLIYQPMEDGSVRLAWNMIIDQLDGQHWWDARVDANTGELISKFDYVNHDNWGPATETKGDTDGIRVGTGSDQEPVAPPAPARDSFTPDAYRVYPLPIESPNHTTPLPPADGRVLVTDPANLAVSPFGWHDTNGAAGAEFQITRGNNVHAYQDSDNDNGPEGDEPNGGPTLVFDLPLDLTQAPTAYMPAAVVNLFYWNNITHDLNAHYGFTSAAGNFQVNTYGMGGIGNDDVQAEAQDGSGTNNANFATPADGQRPRMQMYTWTAPTPDRDGDLDAGIVLHEYGHGISNRLTGTGPGCLGNAEQMGEGWSDWQSLIFTAQASHTATTNRGVGTYALNQPTTGVGIRAFPYNTDMAVDPRTYNGTRTAAAPHGVGSIWTAMLWEMYWALVAQDGFDPNLYTGTGGNNTAIELVNEGLAIQPCSPGFEDGRDAILAADVALNGGANQCLIWEAFAKRGLGFSATQGSTGSNADNTEAFDLPPSCLFLESTPASRNICAGTPATYAINVGQAYTSPVTMSATGNPAGTTATFTPNPVVTIPSTTTLTIGNTAGVAAGAYAITVTGTDPVTSSSVIVDLNVFAAAPSAAPTLTAPADGTVGAPLAPTFTWTASTGADSYLLEVDNDPAFGSLDYSATVNGLSQTSTPLGANTTYYWRVTPINPCGSGAVSAVFDFTTVNQLCVSPALTIGDNATITSNFPVANTGTLTDLDVYFNATHTFVGDLIFTLTHNGTSVILIDRPGRTTTGFGCGGDNVNTNIDDEAALPAETSCNATTGLTTGPYSPNNPLSAFDGQDLSGTWTLTVSDNAGGDTGTLNQWCLLPAVAASAPQLAISLSASQTTVIPGDVVTFTLPVTNTGAGDATGVVVEANINGISQTVPGPTTVVAGTSENYALGYTVTTADCAAGTIVAVGGVDSAEGSAATSNSVTLTCAATAVTLGDIGSNSPSSRAPLAAVALVGVSLMAGLLWRRRRR